MKEIEKRKRIFFISLAIYIVLVIIIASFTRLQFIIFVLMFGLVVGMSVFSICYKKLIVIPFKNNIVGKILKDYKPSITYTYSSSFDYKDFFRNLKLIPQATSFTYEDIIKDEFDEIPYCSMDLLATHQQSTGKGTTTITDFKGKFFIVDYAASFCDFVLKQENGKRVPDGYQSLELESIDFNETFNLYVTNAFEAQKVFTPSRILNLVNFVNSFPDDIMIAYRNEKFYLLIKNNRSQFEKMTDYEKEIIKDYKKQIEDLSACVKIFIK